MKSIFVLLALGGVGLSSAAVAAEPGPFAPVPFDLLAPHPLLPQPPILETQVVEKTKIESSVTTAPDIYRLFVPVALAPRVEYRGWSPGPGEGSSRSVDAPGPGYREQNAKAFGK